MENASKALIIAGAILLSILLIGVGMFIFGKAQEQIGTAANSLNDNQIKVFNNQFEHYEGKQTGSQAKQLLRLLAQNAVKNKEVPELVPTVELVDGGSTTLKADSDSAKYSEAIRKVKDRGTYQVTTEFGANGAISKIKIERTDNKK